MNRTWQTVIGIAVSLALLYWALHDTPLREVWEHVRAANLWILLLAVTIQTSTFLIRAARWKVLLKPALEESDYSACFASTCVGFMANNLLPARVGEFARAYALSRSQPISVSASFGSLVVERLFDGLTLAGFLALPLLLGAVGDPASGQRVTGLMGTAGLLVGLFLAAAAVLSLFIWRPVWASKLFRATLGRLLPAPATAKITEVIESFVQGLGALRRPGLVLGAMGWSIVHWAWGGLAYYVGLLAFDIVAPGYVGALFMQSVNAFAVAVPSSPGFFGPFEASVRVALSPFGVAPARAVSYAVGFHIGSFIPVTVLGLYYVGHLGLTWREVEHSEELVEGTTT